MVKASEAYFNGNFKVVNVRPLEGGEFEIIVITYDGKKGRCVIKRNPDESLEVIEDEDIQ